MYFKSELDDLIIRVADNTYSLKKIPGTIIATNVNDEKDIWHANNGSLSLENVITSDDKSTQHFKISLAVAAGNMYLLLLGEPQPKMSLGVDNKGNYWQLSKHVDLFKEWADCVEDDGNQLRIYGKSIISGSTHVKEQHATLPIVKLTEILIASLFLNDVDLNPGNFGLTCTHNQLTAVKIDPECSFYHYFTDDEVTVNSIRKKLMYYLVGEHHSKGLWESISDNSGNFKDELLYLLHSEEAHKEKMDFLSRFTSMDVNGITSIVMDQVVANTDDLISLKLQLIEKIKQRFDLFKSAYEHIKDVPFQSIIKLSTDGDLWVDELEEYADSTLSSDDSEDESSDQNFIVVNKRKLSVSHSPNPTELKIMKYDLGHCFFHKQSVESYQDIQNNWGVTLQNIDAGIDVLSCCDSHQGLQDKDDIDVDVYFNF
ncbi:hypothetical protein [uncultured Legionella sp.]|uniref:hypothetical protein n=1 Tax=uncultured Legionella sp. TaxID=210934 RepID=UPI0026063480|nr:hypothetical protein [uncultured Legionella sp.]